MKRQILFFSLGVAVGLLGCQFAYAQNKGCPLDIAVRNVKEKNIVYFGQLAEQITSLLTQQNLIAQKAPIPNVPLSQQLSANDIVQFQALRLKILKAQGAKLFASGYERDVDAIQSIANINEFVVSDGNIVESDPRYIYFLLAKLIDITNKASSANPKLGLDSSASKCWVDDGLRFQENFLSDEISKINPNSLLDGINVLASKYNAPFDGSASANQQQWLALITNANDRNTAFKLLTNFSKAKNLWREWNNIETLRICNIDALKKNQFNFESVQSLKTESDLKTVDYAWNSYQSTHSEPNDKLCFQILLIIESKIPSNAELENRNNSDKLKKEGLIK